MSYYGTSFILPVLLAIVAVIAWIVAVGRMTNLGIKYRFRALVLTWAFFAMSMPLVDLNRAHTFDTKMEVYGAVTSCTLLQIGSFGLAVWIYRLLALAYPIRTALSPKEPASVLCVTEGFMADSKSHTTLPAVDSSLEMQVAAAKANTRQMAVVAGEAIEAAKAAQDAEKVTKEAVKAVEKVVDAAKNAALGNP